MLELNEAFKKMDTRTSREKLNELAQEAGRLGKNTLESVQGYVEAADIINVALVDLGDGATQTIAKLTNIFGVEDLLGTKDAMLAVGSTVNVLSQTVRLRSLISLSSHNVWRVSARKRVLPFRKSSLLALSSMPTAKRWRCRRRLSKGDYEPCKQEPRVCRHARNGR